MMKVVSALVTLMLIGVAVKADDKKPSPPITWSTTMPTIELSNQPLEKVLNELKQKLPGFEFSISRENVPHDAPVLPAMTVENISISQFADLIQQELPGVDISETPSHGRAAMNDMPVFHVNITPHHPAAPPLSVHVFELGEIIAHRAAALKDDVKAEDREHIATNDILSLVQASLDVDGDSKYAEMKIHAPTKTLIFKGTDDQVKIVQNVMQVLGNSERYHFEEQMHAEGAEIARLSEELRISRNELYKLKASTQPSMFPSPAK